MTQITEEDQQKLIKAQKVLINKIDSITSIMNRSNHSIDESHARTMQSYLISLEQIIKIQLLTKSSND